MESFGPSINYGALVSDSRTKAKNGKQDKSNIDEQWNFIPLDRVCIESGGPICTDIAFVEGNRCSLGGDHGAYLKARSGLS